MLTPELRCPITATTPASTNCCATVLPVAESARSSTATTSSVTRLPSIEKLFLFSSLTARFTPLSKSCPRAASGPLNGCATPILMVSGILLHPTSKPLAAKGTSASPAVKWRRFKEVVMRETPSNKNVCDWVYTGDGARGVTGKALSLASFR